MRLDRFHHGAGIGEVDRLGQLHADVLLQAGDQTVELLDEGRDARLHQRRDRAGEQVDGGLLAAAQAGAVAAGHRVVVVLVEQQGLQCADLLVQAVDAAEFLRRARQVEPELPVLAQGFDGLGRLGHHLQGIVFANLDALGAALAGVGIDGDREQAAGTLRLLLAIGPVRLGGGKLEAAQRVLQQFEFSGQALAVLALRRVFSEGLGDGPFIDGAHIQAILVELALQLLLDGADRFAQETGRPAAQFDLLHRGVEHVGDLGHQARDGGIGALGIAVAAGGAVLGDPFRMLEANLGHVAEHAGDGGNHGHADEGIDQVVRALAADVKVAGRLPEAVDIGGAAVAFRLLLEHLGQDDLALQHHLASTDLHHLGRDFLQFFITAPDHAQVVFDHALALLAELVVELAFDGLEQGVLGETGPLHDVGRMEERALEHVALHAQLQVGVGGLVAGDLEGIQIEHPDALLDDGLLDMDREGGPDLVGGRQIALDDEHAALGQAGDGVGVQKDLRVGRQHHVDVGVFAVDADRFRRGRQVIGRRLAFLLGAIFRIRLDVPAEQLEQGHGQILACGHRAPATDRVHTHGDGALGHQVGILGAAQGQLVDARIGLLDVLDLDFLLGIGRLFAGELHGQIIERALGAGRQHVLDGGDQAFRLQVARAQAVAAGVQARHVARPAECSIAGIGFLTFLSETVLHALVDRGAHFAHQRQVFGQRLIGTLQHRDALLAFQDMAQHIAREGTEHGDVCNANPDLAVLAQPVGHGLGLHGHGTHADDDVVGIVATVGLDAVITAAGQFGEFLDALVGDFRNVLEEVGTLGRHGLHVGILVGHCAGGHGRIDVPDGRHAAALRAVDDLLSRRRGVDDVVRITQELGHQRLLGHQHRLDQMGGEEAVHADDGRGQRQFGGLARDHVQVGGSLGVLGEDLDESGVVDAVEVVVGAMHVEGGLGDRPAAHVEHVGQTLADRAIE